MNATRNDSRKPPAILLVEDHELLRLSVIGWLRWRFPESRIDAVESGEQALEHARGGCPDVVLMDIDLPGISGIETTRRIKAHLPDTAVVMLTMHDTPHHRLAAADAGAVEYVLKCDMDRVLQPVMERLLQTRSFAASGLRHDPSRLPGAQ